jgi:hypothetical protein
MMGAIPTQREHVIDGYIRANASKVLPGVTDRAQPSFGPQRPLYGSVFGCSLPLEVPRWAYAPAAIPVLSGSELEGAKDA